MAHMIFDHKLALAQKQEQHLADNIAQCRKQLRDALLQDSEPIARKLLRTIADLEPRHQLATEKLAALESTRPEVKQETKEATQLLEQTLPQLNALKNQLPGAYKTFVAKLVDVVAEGQQIIGDYSRLSDLHYQSVYLAALIGTEVEVGTRYFLDPTPLAQLGQRLRQLAQQPTFPNASIKWEGKFAELRKLQNMLAKQERRQAEIAKGRKLGEVFTY